MNYLAHLLLAGPEPDWRLGAMLGDHVRGSDWQHYPADVGTSIRLHRAIDRITDSHAAVAQARALLQPPYRRYAGILLDVFFDHLIARQWPRYSQIPINQFADQIDQLLQRSEAQLPTSLQRFSSYLRHHRLLVNYATVETIEMVLQGISGRLRRDNPIAQATPLLTRHQADWQRALDQLWPDLEQVSAEFRGNDQHP